MTIEEEIPKQKNPQAASPPAVTSRSPPTWKSPRRKQVCAPPPLSKPCPPRNVNPLLCWISGRSITCSSRGASANAMFIANLCRSIRRGRKSHISTLKESSFRVVPPVCMKKTRRWLRPMSTRAECRCSASATDMQAITHQLGGKVTPATKREYGHTVLHISDRASPLFAGLDEALTVWMSHGDSIVEMPPGFKAIGAHGEHAAGGDRQR